MDVFSLASELSNPELYPSVEIAGFCSMLLHEMVIQFRERTFRLIGRAFEEIEIGRAVVMLGVREDLIVSEARQKGWRVDEDTRIIYPADHALIGVQHTERLDSLGSFQGLVHSLVGLDT